MDTQTRDTVTEVHNLLSEYYVTNDKLARALEVPGLFGRLLDEAVRNAAQRADIIDRACQKPYLAEIKLVYRLLSKHPHRARIENYLSFTPAMVQAIQCLSYDEAYSVHCLISLHDAQPGRSRITSLEAHKKHHDYTWECEERHGGLSALVNYLDERLTHARNTACKSFAVDTTIVELSDNGLSPRSAAALRREGFELLAELTFMTESDLMEIRGIGRTTVARVSELLAQHGLTLKSS